MHAPRRIAPRRTALLLAVLAAIGVVVPAIILAATVGQLQTKATTAPYNMTCTPSAVDVLCNAPASRLHPLWKAKITPASGQEDTLGTSASTGQLPLDATSRAWMIDMHTLACGNQKGVDAFVNAVADLTKSANLGPANIGNCTFTGQLVAPGTTVPVYVVNSVFVPPPPTPTAGPTASPAPTAKPTPMPTPMPTPKPTPKPTAAPTLAPTASSASTASATPAPSVAPSASPSVAPSDTPSAAPTATPSATPASTPVNGVEQTPAPPPSAPPGASSPTPGPTAPTFDQSVLGVTDVNEDPAAIGGSLLLALLMLLIIGFAGELFNNTVENNYTEISGWFKKGPLGSLRRMGGKLGGQARIGLLLFLGLTALVSSFVDPNFGPDLRSLGEFLGFLVGLIVVLATFKLPQMLAHRRTTGELGKLRPLPWALIIAALFVLISRIGNLQPGYLYGIVLGAIFVKDVSDKEEGRETFYGSLWTLAAAFLAWLALNWARGLGYDPNGFGITLLSTAFAAILVAGLEATAFGLMPLRFMPGHTVYKWNRLGWALLFGVSVFGFIHLLIGPTSGYVSELSPGAFIAALGVFAVFGALSILTWGYFRFRPQPTTDILQR
ncbi:MAG: FGLLP motif-containing membrane protein [Candidatus Limnocylindrales bacterium]